jgi:hypothetical protein
MRPLGWHRKIMRDRYGDINSQTARITGGLPAIRKFRDPVGGGILSPHIRLCWVPSSILRRRLQLRDARFSSAGCRTQVHNQALPSASPRPPISPHLDKTIAQPGSPHSKKQTPPPSHRQRICSCPSPFGNVSPNLHDPFRENTSFRKRSSLPPHPPTPRAESCPSEPQSNSPQSRKILTHPPKPPNVENLSSPNPKIQSNEP